MASGEPAPSGDGGTMRPAPPALGERAGSGAPTVPRDRLLPRDRAQKLKTDHDAALESLAGQRVYVYGTGLAREVRRDGVLRVVGTPPNTAVRVESQGTLMGFNDFCASAQNSKKRPRQTIYIAETGLSLKQTCEEILGGHESGGISSDDERSSHRAGASGILFAHKSARVCAREEEEEFEGDVDLLDGGEHADEEEVTCAYDMPPVDLTVLLPAKRRVSIAAHKDAAARRARALRACLGLLTDLIVSDVAAPFQEDDEFLGLATLKVQLENNEFHSHSDFAQGMRQMIQEEQEKAGDDAHDVVQGRSRKASLQLLSDCFEDRYLTIADQAQLDEEESSSRLLPRPLDRMPQRLLETWSIIDKKGAFLPPWHGNDALAPGGVFGILTVPPRPPFAGNKRDNCASGEGESDQNHSNEVEQAWSDLVPMQVRLNAPDEWQAQCLDPFGCALPQYWIRGSACKRGVGKGPRSGDGRVWYRLGEPAAGYAAFLRRESSWLMAAYRIAHFLNAWPKSTFNEVCDVIAGRNWVDDTEDKKGGEDGEGSAAKLEPLPLEAVLEHAERVLEEMSNMYPRLSSHKFGNSLMARHHKYLHRKARGLTGAQISSLRMFGGGGGASAGAGGDRKKPQLGGEQVEADVEDRAEVQGQVLGEGSVLSEGGESQPP